jgi:hypothetical protein
LLYNIEQPFYAVPLAGISARNYTFGVYCTVQAYDNINVTTNTTDNGHGDHGGDIVNPSDHVDTKLGGLRPDGSSVLGDPLTYTISLSDDVYASVIPVNCVYYNPSNEAQNVPFVSDSCPRQFPEDPDGYFGTIKQVSATEYLLNFRAFSFETTANSFLGIDCDLQLCIHDNAGMCTSACWGATTVGSTASTSAATTSTRRPTTSTTTEPTTTTTEEATTETTTEEATTETTSETTTEEATTETTTEQGPVPVRLQFRAQFHSIVKRDAGGLKSDGNPDSVTDKKLFSVKIPGVDPDDPCDKPQPVCDTSALTALYVVVGILATLTAVLVLTLAYLIVRRRGNKVDHHGIYDGPYVPAVSR